MELIVTCTSIDKEAYRVLRVARQKSKGTNFYTEHRLSIYDKYDNIWWQ
jgi:hypothetical protein